MVAVFERLEGDRWPFLDILTQFARPQPAHPEVILEKRVDGVDRPVFQLSPDDLFVDALDDQPIRIPAVAPGDDEMLVVGRDQDFFRVFEVEIDRWEDFQELGLIADPDGAPGDRLRFAFQQFRPESAGLLDVSGQFRGGLADHGRSVLNDDDGRGLDVRVGVGVHEDELASDGGRRERIETAEECGQCRFHRHTVSFCFSYGGITTWISELPCGTARAEAINCVISVGPPGGRQMSVATIKGRIATQGWEDALPSPPTFCERGLFDAGSSSSR